MFFRNQRAQNGAQPGGGSQPGDRAVLSTLIAETCLDDYGPNNHPCPRYLVVFKKKFGCSRIPGSRYLAKLPCGRVLTVPDTPYDTKRLPPKLSGEPRGRGQCFQKYSIATGGAGDNFELNIWREVWGQGSFALEIHSFDATSKGIFFVYFVFVRCYVVFVRFYLVFIRFYVVFVRF